MTKDKILWVLVYAFIISLFLCLIFVLVWLEDTRTPINSTCTVIKPCPQCPVCNIDKNFTGLIGIYAMEKGRITSLRCQCDLNITPVPYCCRPGGTNTNIMSIENGTTKEGVQ